MTCTFFNYLPNLKAEINVIHNLLTQYKLFRGFKYV